MMGKTLTEAQADPVSAEVDAGLVAAAGRKELAGRLATKLRQGPITVKDLDAAADLLDPLSPPEGVGLVRYVARDSITGVWFEPDATGEWVRYEDAAAALTAADARLSPAPVGGETEDDDAREAGRAAAERICAKVYGNPDRRRATPPPAEPDGGEPRLIADVICEQNDRIADLEQRLAEAEGRRDYYQEAAERARSGLFKQAAAASAAERDLAEARKRIGALRNAGQRLSNSAFNLSQRDALPEADRNSLRCGWKEWDAALEADANALLTTPTDKAEG